MFYDAAMLARAASEARAHLLGARLRDLVQRHHDEVVLLFGRDRPAPGLLIASSPQFGRACLAESPDERSRPQAFGLALHKHLRGARLVAVDQPGFDRVLRLKFEECQGFGRECTRTLVAEIMGKHGNMVLLDEQDAILSCAKHVPARLNRYRTTLEGEPYVPPPDFGKLDPREVTADSLGERARQDPDAAVPELLLRHCLGVSKVFTAEIMARIGQSGEESPGGSPDLIARLADLVRQVPGEAAQPGPTFLYERPQGSDLPRHFAYPLRLACCRPAAEHPHLGAALAVLVTREMNERRFRELRQRVEGATTSHLRELGRRSSKLGEKVARAKRDEGSRKIGELLLAQPHAAEPYAQTAELVDYYTDGAPTVTVELDPPGDIQRTAQTHFERYKRANRVLRRVPPLLDEVGKESDYLESVLAEIEMADGVDDLEAIEQELTQQGYLKPKQQDTRSRERPGERARQPKSRTSSDGFPILYGTNHLQNDELVRSAAPDDLWLHVQGAPGAHVLVRTSGRPETVPRRTLAEAARLAAERSRLRNQELVDVDYTRAKHVRKPKGERPGMVFYTHQRTLTVRLRE